ncbi:hypothetical protein CUZ56_01731 [Saezia sanguinis]|jgi:type VI secretion system protein|uniref:IraD/Gp25-like domain-containing protein n=1 Tax=Saezia sanguinis TaxID=1965230 RepID=A0A433SCH9_9BURK|nr:type VI secretion system baseplate subunit TssE [Saezia sanguinis]RUS66452.1 hypothetical protein CUZ56_01731 [Saezia sanguinis]
MPRSLGNSSLFDRLGSEDERPRSVSQQGQLAHRIEAIKRNLERMLNTRQGCSQSSPHDGLMDFNDAVLGSSDLMQRIGEDICRVIREGEPRVVVRRVHSIPNPHMPIELNFRIDCLVPVKDKRELVEIDLIMNDGTFKVK